MTPAGQHHYVEMTISWHFANMTTSWMQRLKTSFCPNCHLVQLACSAIFGAIIYGHGRQSHSLWHWKERISSRGSLEYAGIDNLIKAESFWHCLRLGCSWRRLIKQYLVKLITMQTGHARVPGRHSSTVLPKSVAKCEGQTWWNKTWYVSIHTSNTSMLKGATFT